MDFILKAINSIFGVELSSPSTKISLISFIKKNKSNILLIIFITLFSIYNSTKNTCIFHVNQVLKSEEKIESMLKKHQLFQNKIATFTDKRALYNLEIKNKNSIKQTQKWYLVLTKKINSLEASSQTPYLLQDLKSAKIQLEKNIFRYNNEVILHNDLLKKAPTKWIAKYYLSKKEKINIPLNKNLFVLVN